ncbi:MAG: NAD(P)-binding domain-containing protein [Actinomycetes bacterium]
MRIGILGTGIVGQTLGTHWLGLGHEVGLGSRTSGNPEGQRWATGASGPATCGSFQDVAAGAELIVNATPGQVSLSALEQARAHLGGKVILDVANALDFSNGFPPALAVGTNDSLAEQIQRAFPDACVVKSLNTMPVEIMVAPQAVGDGEHDVFVSGDDAAAKQVVIDLLLTTGWHNDRITDLGPLSTARAAELLLPLWLSVMQHSGSRLVTFSVVKA